MSESKRGRLVKRISQIIIIGCVIIAVIIFLWSTQLSPLEAEFKWFKENGYNTTIQKYTDYLDSLSFYYTVNEVKMSKSDFRAKAQYLEQNGVSYKIRWCKELGMLYVARPSEQEDVMDIYYWEP